MLAIIVVSIKSNILIYRIETTVRVSLDPLAVGVDFMR
jgi:hypothetical protein